MNFRSSVLTAALAGLAVSGCEAAKTVATAPVVVVATTAMAINAANTTGFSWSRSSEAATPRTQDPATASFVGMSRDELVAQLGKPFGRSSGRDSLITWKNPDCLIYASLANQNGKMRAISVEALSLKTGLSRETCVATMSKVR